MRALNRNRRSLYYSNPTGTQRIMDGTLFTPEIETTYSTPALLNVNYSAGYGQEEAQPFGMESNYSKAIVMTECPFVEGTLVWIDILPTEQQGGVTVNNRANYRVVRIAKSLNSYAVALNEY